MECWDYYGRCGILGGIGGQNIHSGLVGIIVLCITIFLSFMISMIDLSMEAVHSWSHSRPTESITLDGKPGKMCTFFASGGRDISSKSHVCDDCTMDPFGIFTDNGDVVFVCLCVGCQWKYNLQSTLCLQLYQWYLQQMNIVIFIWTVCIKIGYRIVV